MSGPTARPAQRRAPGSPDVVLCPCGPPSCGVVSLKGLSRKSGHVPNCGLERYGATSPCFSCQGRRNRKKGQAGQAKMHRALGGTGWTPTHEESAKPYTVEVTVMPESKTGSSKVPASWDAFIASKFFTDALSQTTRAVPVGSGAMPCVVIRGDWAIIDIRRKPRKGSENQSNDR